MSQFSCRTINWQVDSSSTRRRSSVGTREKSNCERRRELSNPAAFSWRLRVAWRRRSISSSNSSARNSVAERSVVRANSVRASIVSSMPVSLSALSFGNRGCVSMSALPPERTRRRSGHARTRAALLPADGPPAADRYLYRQPELTLHACSADRQSRLRDDKPPQRVCRCVSPQERSSAERPSGCRQGGHPECRRPSHGKTDQPLWL